MRSGVRPRAGLLACLLAVTVLGASSCGMQEKRQQMELIADSLDRAVEAGGARVTFTQRVELKDERLLSQLRDRGPGAAQGGEQVVETSIDGIARFDENRVAFLSPVASDAAVEPLLIFDGTSIFRRRIASEGGSDSDGRQWLRADLRQLDPDEIDNSVSDTEAAQRSSAMQAALSPNFLMKLLQGTLMGSVERIGVETVRGERTVHYKFNVDREKATEDDPEEVQEAYEAVFKSMFVGSPIVPAEAWIGEDGRLRRFSIKFKTELRRRHLYDTILQFEVFDYGAPIEIALPPDDETVRVDGIAQLAQAAGVGE